jgi:hypothetical protein
MDDGAAWSGRENLRMLERRGYPLGIECAACRRRTVIPLHALRHCGYEMTPVAALPLVCRCGSCNWRPNIFRDGDDPAAWQRALVDASDSIVAR